MCDLTKIVGRPRPSHREAGEPPHVAAVVVGEIIAVLLLDAKDVVAIREVEGDDKVPRAR
jgi:hypothetical protein